MADRPAFVTGSRVYGTPRPDSGLDIVVLLDANTYYKLADHLGCPDCGRGSHAPAGSDHPSASAEESYPPLYLGKINLIPVFSPEMYDGWLKARDLCKAEAPIDRKRAIEIHHQCTQEAEQKRATRRRNDLKTKGKPPTHKPTQGGPMQALRNTHYCRKCRSTPCKCEATS